MSQPEQSCADSVCGAMAMGNEEKSREGALLGEQSCVQAWKKVLPGGAAGKPRVRRAVVRSNVNLPKRDGSARHALREQHEGEHCAMMKFVGKPLFGCGLKKVR
jgi:hypothetical protein